MTIIESSPQIPNQYILAGARFILLTPRQKEPIELDWESKNNYDASSQKLLEHLSHGGNYGVITNGGLCCMDIDNAEEFAKCGLHPVKTFCIKRGNNGRGHIYFKCPDCPPDKRTKHPTSFGDIRLGGNFYMVGANSIHPDGDVYEVAGDNPIAEIPWVDIEPLVNKVRTPGNTSSFILEDIIPDGQRNQTLFTYGCQLLGKGVDYADVISLVQRANTTRCKPSPLPSDEMETLCNSILKYKKGNVLIPMQPFPVPAQHTPQISIPQNYIIHNASNTKGETQSLDIASYADFLKNNFSIVYFNKTIYIYDHGNHFYRPQTNEIETHVRDTVIQNGITEKLQTLLLEIKAHLTSMGCYTDYPFNTSLNDIPVENGIVRMNYQTGEITLLPHSPEHLFTYKLSVVYNPNIKNCYAIPLLKRMVDREDIKTLVQIPAQALLQMQTSHSYKKAYLLQGEPHAGKTSYLKLLYSLFGDDFTTAISLQQLCENHFVGGALEGKLLNIYDDLEDIALTVIDQFKTLTGDCRHGIERKYESVYTGKITAVHIFTCNYPPEYPVRVKRDAAFWARWEYLKFPFTYSVNPNFYSEWYTPDRISSFFNLILAAMIEIKKRGLLSNSEIQDVMMKWSVNSDHLYDFIGTYFEPYSGTTQQSFSKPKLHALYLLWCKDNNIPEHKWHTSIRSFTIALQSHNILVNQIRVGKERHDVFQTLNYSKPFGSKIDLAVVASQSKIGA